MNQNEYKEFCIKAEEWLKTFIYSSILVSFFEYIKGLDQQEGRIHFAANLSSPNNTIIEYVVLAVYITITILLTTVPCVIIQYGIVHIFQHNNVFLIIIMGTVLTITNVMLHMFYLSKRIYYPIITYLLDMFILKVVNKEISLVSLLIGIIIILLI